MSYDYSENILVQESAGELLQRELGWEVAFAHDREVLGPEGTFGRTAYSDVLLSRYFRAALARLNPWLTAAQMDEAESRLRSCLVTSSLLQINKEKYALIRNGIPVSVRLPDGRSEERRARVIDFDKPENDHFLAIREMKIHGSLYRRRTDIVGFVNGIPLLFVELKKPSVAVENAYTDNYTDYLDTIPQLFHFNAFIILSNGTEARVGTLGGKYAFFHEWKRLAESDAGSVALETMLRGICRKENFLDLLENFLLFDRSGGRLVKILARNHQYLGVNEAVKAYADRKLRHGKLGVFWHTQGSGKSYSMLFLARKIRRKFPGSPTFVILTDREELNRQISETFENCDALGDGLKAEQCVATSGSDLVRKLRGNPGFIFTLIQKFNQPDDPPITPAHDIIIMSDEAHRSQYGLFAENMCRLLPTASRIGFTGTPLFADDNITERTFGGYISIYDFQRAVDDHATVPLYYENRGERLKDIPAPDISDRILEAIEQADLDPSRQERLEREFAREIHLLTATPRLEAVARDFVRHYSDLWTSGKAMFVCLNKVTCVRMYELAVRFWQEEKEALARRAAQAGQQEAQELARKLAWMEETEMAVVISQEQNEIQTFRAWGLDIAPHREKMEKRELDKEFKDAAHPLRVVFVCAMWLTGFDVPSLSCLYLDKPLKAHTLMQTIARANRVAEGKSNGLIIDYVGIVKALRKALADYTARDGGSGGNCPAVDKAKLLDRLREDIDAAERLLAGPGIVLADIVDARHFARLDLLQQAANAVCGDEETKKAFQSRVGELLRLCKYVDRDDVTDDVRARRDALEAILGIVQARRKPADNEPLKAQINAIISEYIAVEPASAHDSARFDISRIDFALLQREFARSRRRHLILKDMEDIMRQRLDAMLQADPRRIDYYERYQKIIEAYNREQDRAGIEQTFMELMRLAADMDEESTRYIREGFSSVEELSVYDMLFSEDLSPQDIRTIKAVARDLLARIREKIAEMDHWTQKQATRDALGNLIRDVLWKSLPESFPDESIPAYRDRIYEYVFMRFRDAA